MSNGSDAIRFEQVPAIIQSFAPAITPSVTGSPGPNKYLLSNGLGVVGWGSIPATPSIPSGTGWVKQSPAGTFTNNASVPSAQVSYSPSVPAYWPIIPTETDTALNSLAATLSSVSATASGRAAILSFGIGTATAISTNNYLGALGDQSSNVTSVAPIVIPCTGSLVGIRAQRTTNAASTSVQQFFKSAGGATVSYAGTGVSCSISSGSKECNAATVVPVTIGDMLIVRVTVIVVAKDAGVAPVIKSTTPEVHYLGYAGTPTITGSIVGDDLLLDANGVVAKDITWNLRIERV